MHNSQPMRYQYHKVLKRLTAFLAEYTCTLFYYQHFQKVATITNILLLLDFARQSIHDNSLFRNYIQRLEFMPHTHLGFL